MRTSFTELVGCSIPLQQAGMGGIATPELAKAVSDCGALGSVAGVMHPAADLAAMLDGLGSATTGPVCVNFLAPFMDMEAVEAASSRARVVEFFYGDPSREPVAAAHRGGALAGWQVGSAEEALAAVEAGCDFIAVQGSEAGGHVRGTVGLFPLLAKVLDSARVPVVAAGGIGDARTMAAALAAGAAAVRVGTRFVAAAESAAHPAYRDALLAAGAEDTILTEAFGDMWPDAPHRVLRSCVEAAEALEGDIAGQTSHGPASVPVPRFSPEPPSLATTGHIEAMALYAGESVTNVTKVQPAAEIVRDLAEGAERLLQQWSFKPIASTA